MKQGLYVPNVGHYADPRRLAAYAVAAEASGWDGLFVWDHLLLETPTALPACDTWTALTAILARTRTLIAGPLVTPLARRRPAKVARETVTLDELSGGRLVLGVGLGADARGEFTAFGEPAGARARAERLDEGLAVLRALWTGEEHSHDGTHHHLDKVRFLPAPRHPIPVWTAATHGHARPLARAARHDGVILMVREPTGALRGPTPAELAHTLRALPPLERPDGFQVAVPGTLPADRPDEAAERLRAVQEQGGTWWLEAFDPWRRDPAELRRWIDQGPPLR
ncbi:LLM class flavin-dependent oxidoreductase [Streptomyces griseoflavus]|uniref:LLM class flavin-dependent oxidoreductase n=1 Tax=Streptomyces griseoflavus TaxID=35619 RepID=UPI003D73E5FF